MAIVHTSRILDRMEFAMFSNALDTGVGVTAPSVDRGAAEGAARAQIAWMNTATSVIR